jgi:hypothetical protein
MITRNRILFILGLWTILVPFLGFPSSYKNFFVISAGVLVVVLAFFYARDKRMNKQATGVETAPVKTEVFAESFPGYTQAQAQKPQSIESRYTDIEQLRSRSRLKTF